MSCAKIGSSAVAEAKNVAKKSSSMVERMSGAPNTNWSPSSAERSSTLAAVPSARSGRSRMASSAAITHRNETALAAYAQPTPQNPITSPPSAGPTTDAVWNMIVLRLIAPGRCSRGTSVGMSELRAGLSNAPKPAPAAASR